MKKVILMLTVLLSAVATTAFGQLPVGHFAVTPRAGLSIANLTNNELYTAAGALNSKNKSGFVAGADVEYQLLKPLSLSLGAYFTQQGASYDDYEVKAQDPKYDYEGVHGQSVDLQYINVPLLANLYVGRGLALKAGVQAGFALSAKEKSETTLFNRDELGRYEYAETKEVNQDLSCRNVSFSIPVGISYEWMGIMLDARYNIGLTNIYSKKVEYESKNKWLTFTLGYKFAL